LQNYINQLLKVFNQTTPEPNSPAVYNGEPLTERELEVINWLANGLTNKELADKLVISVGTVTWHLKNLYAKLAVRNRTEAILRAKELNLINP
jgi:ATP/maltotriose-dependent transcriptional regulator MalT